MTGCGRLLPDTGGRRPRADWHKASGCHRASGRYSRRRRVRAARPFRRIDGLGERSVGVVAEFGQRGNGALDLQQVLQLPAEKTRSTSSARRPAAIASPCTQSSSPKTSSKLTARSAPPRSSENATRMSEPTPWKCYFFAHQQVIFRRSYSCTWRKRAYAKRSGRCLKSWTIRRSSCRDSLPPPTRSRRI